MAEVDMMLVNMVHQELIKAVDEIAARHHITNKLGTFRYDSVSGHCKVEFIFNEKELAKLTCLGEAYQPGDMVVLPGSSKCPKEGLEVVKYTNRGKLILKDKEGKTYALKSHAISLLKKVGNSK